MTARDGLHVDGGVTTAQEARLAQAGLLALNGAQAFDVRPGVFANNFSTALLSGTSSTAPWSTQVAGFIGVAIKSTTNGAVVLANDGTVTVSHTAPPASGSRIDVVWFRQRDALAVTSPDADTAAEIGVTTGVASASPAKPALPVGATELGTVTLSSSASAGTSGAGVTIGQTVAQTVARGGILPVRNQTERNALTAYPGLVVARLDLGGVLETFISGAWLRDDRNVVSTTATSTLVGPLWSGQPKIRQEGTALVAISNGAGGCGFTFPEAFPTGLITCQTSPGDRTGSGTNSPWTYTPIGSQWSLSGGGGVAYRVDGAVVAAGVNVRINYSAVGF